MNLLLLVPLGLAALSAWLIPVLIHLIRQPDQKVIDFPALRWLQESVRTRRSPRLDDLWLLVLRLLLLALIALLLAVPVLEGDWHGPRHWFAVSAGVDIDRARSELADVSGEWRWLAADFPTLEGSPEPNQPFASLLREFEASLPESDQLTVLVPPEVDGLDAARIQLGRKIDWRIVPARTMHANAASEMRPRKVALRHASKESEGLTYLRAALAAWDESEPGRWLIDVQTVLAVVPDDTDWLIWLDGTVPAELLPWIAAGGRVVNVDASEVGGVVVLRDEAGVAWARDKAVGGGHVISLAGPLTPAHMPILLDAQFPDRLRELFEGPPAAPVRAFAREVEPGLVERPPRAQQTRLIPALSLLIALIFLIERIVATRRRQLT